MCPVFLNDLASVGSRPEISTSSDASPKSKRSMKERMGLSDSELRSLPILEGGSRALLCSFIDSETSSNTCQNEILWLHDWIHIEFR